MAEKRITDYINNTRLSGVAEQNYLRGLVDRYPYFHAARLLYLRLLFKNHDPNFGTELRKAALYVPSRQVLYQMIEGERLNPAQYARKQNIHLKNNLNGNENRTESLIGQFLDTMTSSKPRRIQKIDASVDYIEFLRQSNVPSEMFMEQSKRTQEGMDREEDVIDKFLQNEGRFVLRAEVQEELSLSQYASSETDEGGILTETMAKIYIKQGKYERAYEIIKRLSLKNPKKNRYFADQMRFLRKIIINNSNK